MKNANLRRILGTRLFVWKPTGYFVVGILDRDGKGYTVIFSFKSNRPSQPRPAVGIGQYRYVDVEIDELTQKAEAR